MGRGGLEGGPGEEGGSEEDPGRGGPGGGPGEEGGVPVKDRPQGGSLGSQPPR